MAIRVVSVLVLLLALGFDADAATAATPSATDELRRHFDQVIATVRQPGFRALGLEERRAAIRRTSDRLFNWGEISRRAMGPSSWSARTAAERRAFTDQFARVAERAYLVPVVQLRESRIHGAPVRYLGERRDGGDTVVSTSLAYLEDLPVDFHMSRHAGRWEVNDVEVKGVSATENYRAQFHRLMAHASFHDVLGHLMAKASAPATEPGGTPMALASPK